MGVRNWAARVFQIPIYPHTARVRETEWVGIIGRTKTYGMRNTFRSCQERRGNGKCAHPWTSQSRRGIPHADESLKWADRDASLRDTDFTHKSVRRTSFPDYLSDQPPTVPMIPQCLSPNSMMDVPTGGWDADAVCRSQTFHRRDTPPMDPDQDRQDVIEATMPSFPPMPRGQPMHIPVDVEIDYESRAWPMEPWDVVADGCAYCESG